MLNKPHNNGDERLMTKFKIGDRVTADNGYSFDPSKGKIASSDEGFYNIKIEGGKADGALWPYPPETIELAQETKVTEFRAGDVVRLVRDGRNAYGVSGSGYDSGSTHVLVNTDSDISNQDGWVAWEVGSGGWVRSDDIELVSRKEEAEWQTLEFAIEPLDFSNWAEGISIDWEDALFGKHETENAGAEYKITRFGDELVSLKISKHTVWMAEDLIELGSHLFALAEYLETGTVDLSDEGECIECENEHLRDSNERLVDANEAKRQRLAKIRELTEE
jgi:hypothetical protein